MLSPLVQWIFGPKLVDAAEKALTVGGAKTLLVCSSSDDSLSWAAKELGRKLRAADYALESYTPAGVEFMLQSINKAFANVPLGVVSRSEQGKNYRNVLVIDDAERLALEEVLVLKRLLEADRSGALRCVCFIKSEMAAVASLAVGQLSALATGWALDVGFLSTEGEEGSAQLTESSASVDASSAAVLPTVISLGEGGREKADASESQEVVIDDSADRPSRWRTGSLVAFCCLVLSALAIGNRYFLAPRFYASVTYLCGGYDSVEQSDFIESKLKTNLVRKFERDGKFFVEFKRKTGMFDFDTIPEQIWSLGSCRPHAGN